MSTFSRRRTCWETLQNTCRVNATVLDPWYNKGVGGVRVDYDAWLSEVIHAASKVADHIFVWGFRRSLHTRFRTSRPGSLWSRGSLGTTKTARSVIRGWRSAQNACLHLAADDAPTYPELFLNGEQLARWKAGKMRFVPGPPSVLEAPLNIGFVGRHEQTGHPAQKPLSVVEPLVLMSTKEGDTVLDPMCGSGTTGEACLRLKRNAILCDESEDYTQVARERIAKSLTREIGQYPSASSGKADITS